ncbi:MAG: DUF1499 domain-containing protein [Devosia sp.]
MRILVRTSKWAVWSRRIGALALPLAIIPVFLHRSHYIPSETFVVIEAVALALAAMAAFAGLVAIVRLWFTGDRGWGRAVFGFLFGAICLAPAAWLAFEAIRLPATPDVSTDFNNPPSLVSFVPARFLSADERTRIEEAFPNARSRTYPIAVADMYPIVENLMISRGWDIRTRTLPVNAFDAGQINAIATTLLGWRQEVVLRITGSADGSTIAMRSASLSDFHDFAENGHRVEAFLLELDSLVTLTLRDAPATPAATE